MTGFDFNHDKVLTDLEQHLLRRYGLSDARARAATLLDGQTFATAEEELRTARAARRRAIDAAAPLATIDEAGERERAALATLERLAGWRARGEARIAVDVFTASASLGAAADPRWHPGMGADLGGPRPPTFLRRPS
ncbi:MAG: hypothetical protein KC431_11840, partial [Myxococcales bacterium]|nr:hypothetical protein [Myxococcales bacterium]